MIESRKSRPLVSLIAFSISLSAIAIGSLALVVGMNHFAIAVSSPFVVFGAVTAGGRHDRKVIVVGIIVAVVFLILVFLIFTGDTPTRPFIYAV